MTLCRSVATVSSILRTGAGLAGDVSGGGGFSLLAAAVEAAAARDSTSAAAISAAVSPAAARAGAAFPLGALLSF